MRGPIIFGLLVVSVQQCLSAMYLGDAFCSSSELEDECDARGPFGEYCNEGSQPRKCRAQTVSINETNCSDLSITLLEQVPPSYTLAAFMTQQKCTMPNSINPRDTAGFQLLKEVSNINSNATSVSFGPVDGSNFCGLWNLVFVLSDNAQFYVEHQVETLFVNCSNVNFGVDVAINDTLVVSPETRGPLNDVSVKITNIGNGKCQPQVMMCLFCDHSSQAINNNPMGTKAFTKFLASKPFNKKMQELDDCHPLHESFLIPSETGFLDLENITIPCNNPAIEGQHCGVIVFADPLDTCLDTDSSDNIGYIPVFVNSSDCFYEKMNDNEKCQAFSDPMSDSMGLFKYSPYRGAYGAVFRGNAIINVRRENPLAKIIKGRSRISAWNKGLCDDQCTSLYNFKKATYDAQNKFSSRVLDLASNLAKKASSIDASRGENDKMIKITSFMSTLLRCSIEDSETCPFAPDIVSGLIMLIKDAMQMKHHRNRGSHGGDDDENDDDYKNTVYDEDYDSGYDEDDFGYDDGGSGTDNEGSGDEYNGSYDQGSGYGNVRRKRQILKRLGDTLGCSEAAGLGDCLKDKFKPKRADSADGRGAGSGGDFEETLEELAKNFEWDSEESSTTESSAIKEIIDSLGSDGFSLDGLKSKLTGFLGFNSTKTQAGILGKLSSMFECDTSENIHDCLQKEVINLLDNPGRPDYPAVTDILDKIGQKLDCKRDNILSCIENATKLENEQSKAFDNIRSEIETLIKQGNNQGSNMDWSGIKAKLSGLLKQNVGASNDSGILTRLSKQLDCKEGDSLPDCIKNAVKEMQSGSLDYQGSESFDFASKRLKSSSKSNERQQGRDTKQRGNNRDQSNQSQPNRKEGKDDSRSDESSEDESSEEYYYNNDSQGRNTGLQQQKGKGGKEDNQLQGSRGQNSRRQQNRGGKSGSEESGEDEDSEEYYYNNDSQGRNAGRQQQGGKRNNQQQIEGSRGQNNRRQQNSGGKSGSDESGEDESSEEYYYNNDSQGWSAGRQQQGKGGNQQGRNQGNQNSPADQDRQNQGKGKNGQRPPQGEQDQQGPSQRGQAKNGQQGQKGQAGNGQEGQQGFDQNEQQRQGQQGQGQRGASKNGQQGSKGLGGNGQKGQQEMSPDQNGQQGQNRQDGQKDQVGFGQGGQQRPDQNGQQRPDKNGQQRPDQNEQQSQGQQGQGQRGPVDNGQKGQKEQGGNGQGGQQEIGYQDKNGHQGQGKQGQGQRGVDGNGQGGQNGQQSQTGPGKNGQQGQKEQGGNGKEEIGPNAQQGPDQNGQQGMGHKEIGQQSPNKNGPRGQDEQIHGQKGSGQKLPIDNGQEDYYGDGYTYPENKEYLYDKGPEGNEDYLSQDGGSNRHKGQRRNDQNWQQQWPNRIGQRDEGRTSFSKDRRPNKDQQGYYGDRGQGWTQNGKYGSQQNWKGNKNPLDSLERKVVSLLRCGNSGKMSCNARPLATDQVIGECACHLIWAKDSPSSNKFCQFLNDDEKENFADLAIMTLKNGLPQFPEKMKVASKFTTILRTAALEVAASMKAPVEASELESTMLKAKERLANLTSSANGDLGPLPVAVHDFIDKLTKDDYVSIASIVNEILGFFTMGNSCDFDGVTGFPTREEFCQSHLDDMYSRQIMDCNFDLNTHVNAAAEWNNFMWGVFPMSNETVDSSYVDTEDDAAFMGSPRRRMTPKKKAQRGSQCNQGSPKGQSPQQVFWRMEDETFKVGTFCDLTKAYHWKPVASCKKCNSCGKRSEGFGGNKGRKDNQGNKGKGGFRQY